MALAFACPCPDLEALLDAHSRKDVLRFITCGSVDDGKSTLIGRLLHDSRQLFEDQLVALRHDSRRSAYAQGGVDFSLLVDGLAAEREQGITIDVAYRFFSTDRRSFIVADTPGHEQYTRNMATGASTADLAVLLVDARKGLSPQTRRHSLLLSMLGIRRIVLAINKMDLVGWSELAYRSIVDDYAAFARGLGFDEIAGIPLSALNGDNVVDPAVAAAWYGGLPLLRHLESVQLGVNTDQRFRMPVQWVSRPDRDFRGYAGRIAGGAVSVGDRVRVLPRGGETRIARIVTFDGDLDHAAHGRSVTLTVEDDIDISRGDVLAAVEAPPIVSDRARVRLFWVGERPVAAGGTLRAKIGTAAATATVEAITGIVDLDTAQVKEAAALSCNDIGDAVLAFDRPVAFDPYEANRETGSLILVDPETCETVAIGLATR